MRPPSSKIRIRRCRIYTSRRNIHPLHRTIHPHCRTSPQLYAGMLQPAVTGYIRYTGISLGAVRTLVWSSFFVSNIFSSTTFRACSLMHNQCFVLREQLVAMLAWDLSNGVDFVVLFETRLSNVCLATDIAFMNSCRTGMNPLVDLQGIGIPKYFVASGTLQS